MILPADIRQHAFGKALRGYDVDEVRAYLNSLANEVEELQLRLSQQKEELAASRNSLSHYQELEKKLRASLEAAEQRIRDTREDADRLAIVKLHEAEKESARMLADAQQNRAQLAAEAAMLARQRDELIGQLRALMQTELDRLARFEQHEMSRPLNAGPLAEGAAHQAAIPSFFEQVLASDTGNYFIEELVSPLQ